jgi:hypothetical protein
MTLGRKLARQQKDLGLRAASGDARVAIQKRRYAWRVEDDIVLRGHWVSLRLSRSDGNASVGALREDARSFRKATLSSVS